MQAQSFLVHLELRKQRKMHLKQLALKSDKLQAKLRA
jgi:hypothetical protein